MAIYQRPIDAILAAIRDLNGPLLVEEQYTFGIPTAMVIPTPTQNTDLLITAIVPGSPYQGGVTVQYKRLDLSELNILLPLPIAGPSFLTTRDVAVSLNNSHGMNFVESDLENTPVELVDGTGAVTLVAKPESLGWIGQVTLQVKKGNYQIDDYVTVKSLPGLNYPGHDVTKPFAEVYSYWRDFSVKKTELATIALGGSSLATLATVLTAVTGDAWVTSGVSRFSLEGAIVDFNGLTLGKAEYNSSYISALRVTLSESNLGYSGQLVLHYKLVIDDFTAF